MRETRQASPESVLKGPAERFERKEVPFKVRKLELLKEIGLPTREFSFYSTDALVELGNHLSRELATRPDAPFVLRVACNPDRLSTPSFRIYTSEDVPSALESLSGLIIKDKTIKQIIVRPFIPEEKIKDRVVGRLSFLSDQTDTQEILELYKGAESTGVFNNVDPRNPRFRSFAKKAGEFMKPDGGGLERNEVGEQVAQEEIQEIYRQIQSNKEKMETLRGVVAHSQGTRQDQTPLTFEFSYLNGEFWFTDFD